MMKMNRRQLLKLSRDTGVSLAALPLLTPLNSFAQTNGVRGNKRLLVVWHPHGMHQPSWTCGAGSRSGDDWQLSRVLEPLSAVKSKTNIIEGVTGVFSNEDERHQRGMVGLLTGCDLFAESKSLDQVVADYWGVKPLLLGTQVEPFLYNSKSGYENFRISFRGTGKEGAQIANNDPFAAYKKVFTGGGEDADMRFVNNKSVLDAVLAEINAVKSRLSQEDFHLLDAHQTSIREIECSLYDVYCENEIGQNPQALSCSAPNIRQAPNNLDEFLRQQSNFPAIAKLQSGIAKVAVGCGLAPVTVLQFAATESTHTYSWVLNEDGQPATSSEHHGLSHSIYFGGRAQKDFNAINRWYAQQVADIATYLDSIPEGNGTALDNTLIYWGTCMGNPQDHWQNNWSSVTVGNADGFFRTNQNLDFRNPTATRCFTEPQNCHLEPRSPVSQVDIINTLAASMGLPATDTNAVVGNIDVDRNSATHVSRAYNGLVRGLMS